MNNYSPEDAAKINSLGEECAALFPSGKVYSSPAELREELKAFANTKGFAVASEGSRIRCTRAEESLAIQNKRIRRGTVPEEKQRNRTSTRCGCPFRVCFTKVDRSDKNSKAIKITPGSVYTHGNGCLPSRGQLVVEKRKAGAYSVAVNETQIKSILILMKTGKRVTTPILRELMKPL